MEYSFPPLFTSNFEKDVFEGLTASPKYLQSKYFYDEKGDELFQQIMDQPEYYLTNSELEILSSNKEKILQVINSKEAFQLIDLGAGDAYKTKILLKHLIQKEIDFTYTPVDISEHAVEKLTTDLSAEIPGIRLNGIAKEYLGALKSLDQSHRKVILFLGASIGNFSLQETLIFLRKVSELMSKDDLFLIGFDLKKDPKIILAAYNDRAGVTKKFNLNLLHRVNRELGANFDTSFFEHLPTYHPESGEARSALISIANQTVDLSGINLSVKLKEGEPIHTEISRKYSLEEIAALAEASGFEVVENILDKKEFFTNTIWKKKEDFSNSAL